MRISTTTLIQQLKQPIQRTPWDNKVSMTDAAEVEKLMQETTVPLEQFLDYAVRKESKTNDQPYGMA